MYGAPQGQNPGYAAYGGNCAGGCSGPCPGQCGAQGVPYGAYGGYAAPAAPSGYGGHDGGYNGHAAAGRNMGNGYSGCQGCGPGGDGYSGGCQGCQHAGNGYDQQGMSSGFSQQPDYGGHQSYDNYDQGGYSYGHGSGQAQGMSYNDGSYGGSFNRGPGQKGYGGRDDYRGGYGDYDDDDDHFYPKYNQGAGPEYAQETLASRTFADARITILGKEGEPVPDAMSTFEQCDQVFPPLVMKQLRQAGFQQPTPIQASTWAMAIQGRDVIGVAKTGSGKTLAFLLPGFMRIINGGFHGRGPYILAMAPTRELAKQIEEESQKFGHPCSIMSACLYGGVPRYQQLQQVRRGVQVIVATPGRLNDFLESRQVDLSRCTYVILDEADRMLDMGFEPQIRSILVKAPQQRQTLLYTATWAKEVRSLASDFLTNPFCVTVGQEKLAANEDVTQEVVIVQDDQQKLDEVRKILEKCVQGDLVLIFCDTKAGCAWLGEHLYSQYRIPCTALHGDLSQWDRDKAIQNFKSGRRPIMVGTDVAARGLDIKGIKAVINFDPAGDSEDYVHRIGRTGRAGQKGYAYTLLTPKNGKKARDIVKVMQAGNVQVPQELVELAGMARGGCGRKGKGKGKGKGGCKGGGKGGPRKGKGGGGKGKPMMFD